MISHSPPYDTMNRGPYLGCPGGVAGSHPRFLSQNTWVDGFWLPTSEFFPDRLEIRAPT